jgi:hypothetical protein
MQQLWIKIKILTNTLFGSTIVGLLEEAKMKQVLSAMLVGLLAAACGDRPSDIVARIPPIPNICAPYQDAAFTVLVDNVEGDSANTRGNEDVKIFYGAVGICGKIPADTDVIAHLTARLLQLERHEITAETLEIHMSISRQGEPSWQEDQFVSLVEPGKSPPVNGSITHMKVFIPAEAIAGPRFLSVDIRADPAKSWWVGEFELALECTATPCTTTARHPNKAVVTHRP